MTAPILDLDTMMQRPTITIDGKNYEIVSPDELPVATLQRLGARGRRLEELMKLDEPNRDQRGELERIVREVSETIMEPVPPEIRGKLSEVHRLRVLEGFTALLLRKRFEAAAAMIPSQPAKPSTGETSSPGSSGSTADAREAGSSTSPPGS